MADDYSHGYGIQTVDVGDYFATRDFTLNEVLVVGGEMICTPDAFRAYKLGLITPSANERVTSRTQVKAQYLCAIDGYHTSSAYHQQVIAGWSRRLSFIRHCSVPQQSDDEGKEGCQHLLQESEQSWNALDKR